jgi:hypothetical protein
MMRYYLFIKIYNIIKIVNKVKFYDIKKIELNISLNFHPVNKSKK